jgi:hypothetical protein
MSAQVIEAKLEAESRAFQKLQKGIVLLFGNGSTYFQICPPCPDLRLT